MKLTPEMCRELLEYNPASGELIWRARVPSMFRAPCLCESWNRRFAGKVATRALSGRRGYTRLIVRMPDRKDYLAHRVIWLHVMGAWPKGEVDHINRDSMDNRWSNLRLLDRQGNARNQSIFKTSSSGFTGVNWRACRKKWRAQVTIDGRHVHLGYFDTIIDAVAERIRANDLYGFHDGHGKPKTY